MALTLGQGSAKGAFRLLEGGSSEENSNDRRETHREFSRLVSGYLLGSDNSLQI